MIFNATGGGGAALNFKVQAYATEEELLAATPSENTIGIITDTPITSWLFSAEEPSPAEAGKVWITTGTYSPVAFNALKKNGIQVYPISAKQYVSGAWVEVTAKSWQGGEWVQWWDGTLYDSGIWYQDFYYEAGPKKYGTITANSDHILLKTNTGEDNSVDLTVTPNIDFTNYKTVTLEYSTFTGGASDRSVTLRVSNSSGTQLTYVKTATTGSGTLTLDVNSISEKCTLWLRLYNSLTGTAAASVKITKIKLEQ